MRKRARAKSLDKYGNQQVIAKDMPGCDVTSTLDGIFLWKLQPERSSTTTGWFLKGISIWKLFKTFQLGKAL